MHAVPGGTSAVIWALTAVRGHGYEEPSLFFVPAAKARKSVVGFAGRRPTRSQITVFSIFATLVVKM
jgi:hypothetical protein